MTELTVCRSASSPPDRLTLDSFFNLSDNSLRLIIVLTNKVPDKDREEHVSQLISDLWLSAAGRTERLPQFS